MPCAKKCAAKWASPIAPCWAISAMRVGHYFWDRLVAPDRRELAAFRALFGDERADYGQALQKHYEKARRPTGRTTLSASTPPPIPGRISPRPGRTICTSWIRWRRRRAFGLKVKPRARAAKSRRRSISIPTRPRAWKQLIDAWLPIEFATNSLNRSMGLTGSLSLCAVAQGDREAGLHPCPDPSKAELRKTADASDACRR